ncbi:hypothetical protein EVAR_64489_1 [Eumeta japonica]|uniref:Uncharacterized protein n=1 Tax=Eumeta variegata TaxID=151549 RepID=A0A4C1ZYE7_EUMVA|nr:hypothetical protein EVAR_64489_1 [Eumeta japonica]
MTGHYATIEPEDRCGKDQRRLGSGWQTPPRLYDQSDTEQQCGCSSRVMIVTKEQSVYFPPVVFGQNKFFAPVLENYPTTAMWLTETLWKLVEFCIPPSDFDGEFDLPLPVADVRHQDSVLCHVKDAVSKAPPSPSQTSVPPETERSKPKSSTTLKSKNKSSRAGDTKTEMRLSGHTLLAGIGRVVAFEIEGSRNPNTGEVVVTASAGRLPTRDDAPVVFINVTELHDAPGRDCRIENKAQVAAVCGGQTYVEYQALMPTRTPLRGGVYDMSSFCRSIGPYKYHSVVVPRISCIIEVYTRWKCGGVVHASESIQLKDEVHFKDTYVLPMAPEMASLVVAEFAEAPLEIELRGIGQVTPISLASKFSGADDARDKHVDKGLSKKEEGSRTDLLIAVCRVDVIGLSKGNSAIVNGEFPLYPPNKRTAEIDREDRCTNDINRIRVPIDSEQVPSASMVLEAQMTLRVSVGYVGCTPPKLVTGFVRLHCSMGKDGSTSEVREKLMSINEKLQNVERLEDTLTGWMCDVGSCTLIFLEGSADEVFHIWDFMRNFHPHIRIVFCPSNVHPQRIYHGNTIIKADPSFSYMPLICVDSGIGCAGCFKQPLSGDRSSTEQK